MSTDKTLPEPVAWRYVPSKVWGDQVVTQDPKTVQLAREYGRDVEGLYTADQLRAALAAQAEAHATELAAEHERGRQQGITDCYDDVLTAKQHNVELRAKVEALRADAERYRWLRDNRVSENDDGEKCVYFWCDFEHYDDVDAAIDAARASAVRL